MSLHFAKAIQKVTTPLRGSVPYTANYKLAVKLKFDGYTVLEMYIALFPKINQSIWIDKIKSGLLTVNGKACLPNLLLKAGWLTQNTVHNKIEPLVNTAIELIYEDDNILVINKPSPLPMHPSGRFNKNTLTEILKLAFTKDNYKIVHRLDANTTGVIILAKHLEIANTIGSQFRANTVKKEYLAIVEGLIEKDTQIISEKISTNKTVSGGREINDTGLDSETKITVLKRNFIKAITLLKVEPKNGRTNQIRLHLASISHPIIGDIGYKDKNYFKNNPLTYSNDSLYLHAHKIKITYNNTEKQFIAKKPEKFSILIAE